MFEKFNKLKLIKNNNKEKDQIEQDYNVLGPIDDIDENSPYLKSLDWALKNKDVKNLAISGTYGSGKSSIIKTYLKKHKEIAKEAIQISLASFRIDENDKCNNNDEYKKYIERAILTQLFYKVKHSKIPQSRYRKLHKISYKNILGFVLFVLISISLVVVLIWDDILQIIQNKITRLSNYFQINENISYGIIFLLVVIFVAIVTKKYPYMHSRMKITEVKLPLQTSFKNEVDLDKSIFDKNMDEIFYFFEATKYRIVFFEDLDRLNNSDIFIHLRELNTILNNYKEFKKSIVFVYALRDDIFIGEDRTKFFDFIIPVIPVVSAANSSSYLLKELNINKDYNVSINFIYGIAPFINEMRILLNIINEFNIYKENIPLNNETGLKAEKMLALIVFKNLYPKDFEALQIKRGIIRKALEDKNDYINNLCQVLKDEKKSY